MSNSKALAVLGDLKPFTTLPFESVPEKPLIPHPYFDTEAIELKMKSQHFGELNIHYRKYGSGPPLLLLHGLMTTGYSWRYALQPLGEHYTLYVPDLPGAGRSDKPLNVTYHAIQVARWIAEFQQAAGIRGCRVIGNSMAGYLCLILGLIDPHAMSHLVNLHSPGIPEARFYALRAVTAIPGVRSLFTWVVQRDPIRWAHKNVHYYDERLKSLEEAHEYGDPLMTKEGAWAFTKYMTETMRPGPMKALQKKLRLRMSDGMKYPAKLLLVYAENDPLVPSHIGDVFAREIHGAKLIKLSQASHFAHVDAVDRFVPPVLQFLSG
jgi:pimeloyl-ACP methyl ester carboxylesterase